MTNIQELEIDRVTNKITIRNEKFTRTDNTHTFSVLQPIFRQAYLKSLRLRKGQSVSTNLVEMALFAPFVPFLADFSDTTVYFNEIPGKLGQALTRVAEDNFAEKLVIVNSQLVNKLEVHRFPGYNIIRYLDEIHAFEINVEHRNFSSENEVVEPEKKASGKK
jgi:hypothetical protein